SYHTTVIPDKPGNSSLERDQAIITESNHSQSDHNNQSTSIGQQSTSRFERGIKTTSTPIPSRPPTPVHLSMGAPIYDFNTQQPETAAGPSGLTPAPERELNNKSTTLPPSPVASTPNLPNTTLTRAAEKSRASEPESLLGAMKWHPTFPPGRNYIPLDQPADALALIAYMALQARLIVCVIPSSPQSLYTQILRSLTDSNVHFIDEPQDYAKYLTSSAQAKTTYQDILLTPCNNYRLNCGWMRESQPDCILHWTEPANVYFVTTRNVVNSLPRTVLACVLVVGENSFDANAHEVVPYPKTVLEHCFQSHSPFHMFRQIASQSLPAAPATPVARVPQPQQPPSPAPRLNVPTSSPSTNPVTIPAGNYYIVLDEASHLNVIPLIAYIALNTKKVICHIPEVEDVNRYHTLLKYIANLNVILHVGKSKKIKGRIQELKSKTGGILIKNIVSEWNSFWAKSLVDAVVYFGVPSDLTYYLNECNLKVDYSYLILTRTQYYSIQSKLSSHRRLQQHPLIRGSESFKPGGLLYALRQDLALRI
ncbi:hypothetical protein RHS04_00419, partial [Rhizoctonia solani]